MMPITDGDESSKQFVERVFPRTTGTLKGSLILAHGCGFDAGMAKAAKIMMNAFAELGVPLGVMEAAFGEMEALTKNGGEVGNGAALCGGRR